MLESLDGLCYPVELRWIQAHGLKSLTPWHFLSEDRARGLRGEFQKETATSFHTLRDILPFASRQDCDDIAAFVVEQGAVSSRVVVAHLTWRGVPEVEGFPSVWHYDSFWTWLKEAIDETVSWCSEEDLAEFLSD